jgi:hypothetical protein
MDSSSIPVLFCFFALGTPFHNAYPCEISELKRPLVALRTVTRSHALRRQSGQSTACVHSADLTDLK